MTYWTRPSFKALQEEWYQRLKDEGFKDAEMVIDGKHTLENKRTREYQSTPKVVRETKEEYYAVLAQCVHCHWFDDDIERRVLTWYAQGRRIRDICDDLERMGEPRARDTIRYMVRRYEVIWGLRTYTRQQLHLKPKAPIP